MNILIISPDYPDDNRSVFPFVKQLVDEMANQGHSVQIIAPYSLTHNKRLAKRVTSYIIGESKVTVYRPYYVSVSNIRIGKRSFTDTIKRLAYKKGFRMLKEKPDVVYGHFWNSAFMGYEYAKENNLPLYVATGESEIEFRSNSQEKEEFCAYLSGVVCVSTKNKEESIKLSLTTEDKCIVVPNAIDASLFKKLDKSSCRADLGLPQDIFIIAFVGWFNERKGSERVATAVAMIEGDSTTVYSVFIGDGTADPKCDNILFKGKLPHKEIPKYLNAADVFVLPTLREGCCNAVIEAMACGLPIISSNLPFNWDVLNSTNSILVNPQNIEEIARAICKIRDDKKFCESLSQGALKSAEKLSIDQRASRILDFIKSNS